MSTNVTPIACLNTCGSERIFNDVCGSISGGECDGNNEVSSNET